MTKKQKPKSKTNENIMKITYTLHKNEQNETSIF